MIPNLDDLWPRWLKLKDAARYSSIGQKRLIELARAGIVRGFQDPDHGNKPWIFDRYSAAIGSGISGTLVNFAEKHLQENGIDRREEESKE